MIRNGTSAKVVTRDLRSKTKTTRNERRKKDESTARSEGDENRAVVVKSDRSEPKEKKDEVVAGGDVVWHGTERNGLTRNARARAREAGGAGPLAPRPSRARPGGEEACRVKAERRVRPRPPFSREDGDALSCHAPRPTREAGDDPRYVARRLMNFAAEDVGAADPAALGVAVAAAQAAQLMGMPEV